MAGKCWVCCGVLRREIEKLHQQGDINGSVSFLDSMLHMEPDRLEFILGEIVEKLDSETVVVYGDCSPNMHKFSKKEHVCRVGAMNCAQLLLGKAKYRQLMKEQAFILLPEWVIRWREIFAVELGLNKEVATSLMQENRKILVYLDTGLIPVPEKDLQECSEYVGLPYRIEKITLENLLEGLKKAESCLNCSSGKGHE